MPTLRTCGPSGRYALVRLAACALLSGCATTKVATRSRTVTVTKDPIPIVEGDWRLAVRAELHEEGETSRIRTWTERVCRQLLVHRRRVKVVSEYKHGLHPSVGTPLLIAAVALTVGGFLTWAASGAPRLSSGRSRGNVGLALAGAGVSLFMPRLAQSVIPFTAQTEQSETVTGSSRIPCGKAAVVEEGIMLHAADGTLLVKGTTDNQGYAELEVDEAALRRAARPLSYVVAGASVSAAAE